jgi:hypothetical protein
MTMQRRERILVYVTGGLLAFLAVWYLLWGGDPRPYAQLVGERTQLEKDKKLKEHQVLVDQRNKKQLQKWRHIALPSEPAAAKSLYKSWLFGLADHHHFSQLSIDPKETESHRDAFSLTRMSFTVRGRISLADLTQFLFDFYKAGHLQQIRQMDIKPAENAQGLDVSLTIEALSFPTADRKDQLTKEPGHGLKLAKADDYRDPIVKRNLFARYTPPVSAAHSADAQHTKKPEKPTDPMADTAQYAFVTGFTEVDGVPQVWIQDRMAGKNWKLAEGQEFKIGKLHGTVRKIATDREVTLDFDGHRRRLGVGDNLRGGVEVDGRGKN